MPEEIINRVTQSRLEVVDLEDYYPSGPRIALDIKDWLFEGIILREKEFRKALTEHDWTPYSNAYVALHCSTDAIVPGWAYILVSSMLQPYAKKVVLGDLEVMETQLYESVIDGLDLTYLQDKAVIIKGCSNKPVPPNAYISLMAKIQPWAKSIMYGEACSAVPLYKRKPTQD